MKRLKSLASIVLLMCLILTLTPSALASEGGEAFYEDKSWDDVVDYLLDKYDVNREKIAIGYRNTVTGEEHFVNPDQYMVSGSMYKVPLNMVFTEKIYNGEMDWDTQIGGIAYSKLLEDSIVESSNDYAKILWTEAGKDGGGTSPYNSYRRKIAPYMGEDPDTVDAKYYENNFSTPRQMIHCLNLLATESERFPRLIETMQQAEPHNYFKLREQRYDIGHKYGFFLDGQRLYMADCAVAYTDEPIVFVMYTDWVSNAYDVLADFATLMCEYTQFNTSRRLKAEEEARKAEEEKREQASAQNTAPAQQETLEQLNEPQPELPEKGSMGLGSVISVLLVAVAFIASAAAVLSNRKKGRIKAGWALIALILAAAAMLLCIAGYAAGTIVAKPEGDPRQAAAEFMDSIISGDYDSAYSRLNAYSSLGLENSPADETGRLMYDALRESYSYELSGSCFTDKLQARQQIQFTYLNLPAMVEDIGTETTKELEKIVKTHSARQIYDENNNYFPEITDEAYALAVKNVLAHAEDYYVSAGIQLQLVYNDGMWKIVPAESLIRALSGGTAK